MIEQVLVELMEILFQKQTGLEFRDRVKFRVKVRIGKLGLGLGKL